MEIGLDGARAHGENLAMEPSASSRAYAYVRDQILSGKLQPDTMISEGDVASELGVSRTPVREAFQVLARENWIRVYPRRGALVLRRKAVTVQEFFEFRAVVESWALRKVIAAPDQGEELVSELRAALADIRDVLAAEPHVFRETASRIHAIIFRATGNALVSEVFDWLGQQQFRVGMTFYRSDTSPEERRDLLARYEGLVRAIQQSDAEAACQILTALLQAAVGLRRAPING